MPMPDGGRDVRLLRNPQTGAFDSFDWDDSNNPAFDDSDEHLVLSYLLETSYWANPLRGSKVPSVKLDRAGTASELRADAEAALQPALDAKQIRSASAVAERRGPGKYSLDVRYRSRDGRSRSTRLPVGS